MIEIVREAKEVLNELSYVLTTKQKTQAVKVLIVIIISSWLELIGVSAVLPFMQAIIAPDNLLQNVYVQKMMKILQLDVSAKMLIMLVGVGLILVYLIKNLFMIFSLYIQQDYITVIQRDLSNRMLHSYMSRPYTFFLETNSSVIVRGSTESIAGLHQILYNLLTMIAEIISVVMIGVYLLYTDTWIAVTALLLMAIILVALVLFFRPMVKRSGKKNMMVLAKRNKVVYQAVNGIKEIYVMHRQHLFEEEYEEASEIYRNTQRNYSFLNVCPDKIVEGVCISGLIGIVCIRLLIGGEMSDFVPKLAVFAMAAFKMLPSIGKISARINNIIYYRPMLLDVYNNVKETNQYRESQNRYILDQSIINSDKHCLRLCEQVTVNKVVWRYKNQNQDVLRGTTLTIMKGQAVGLIGASGAGKTTLVDMILGLLKPQAGTIEMDGRDIYTIPEAWSRMVGYVPQAVFLMDDTVRNNVCFGLREEDADDESVWEALERAQLKEFIQGLPNGLDTIVGERGVKFSGGQRQRIAIARALYCRPEILILDEATAALDNETEAAVMESIDSLQGQITMIIVAHRLTTIKKCDVIYEIADGRAIQREKAEVIR